MLGSMLMKVLPDSTVGLTREQIDITDKNSVQQMFAKYNPQVVINAAAYTAVDDCESQPEVAMAVNAVAVGHLAQQAAKVKATLVHYSTDYVFNGQNVNGYVEADQYDPVNMYGESKAAGEQAILDVAESANWRSWYVIRIAWLYGPGGNNFVDTMLALAAKKEAISVVNDQHGSPTYSKDVAELTEHLLDGDYPAGVYHGSNAGNCTWFEFAQKIFKLSKSSVKVVPCGTAEFPRPAPRPEYSILRNTKLPLARSWEVALADYLLHR